MLLWRQVLDPDVRQRPEKGSRDLENRTRSSSNGSVLLPLVHIEQQKVRAGCCVWSLPCSGRNLCHTSTRRINDAESPPCFLAFSHYLQFLLPSIPINCPLKIPFCDTPCSLFVSFITYTPPGLLHQSIVPLTSSSRRRT